MVASLLIAIFEHALSFRFHLSVTELCLFYLSLINPRTYKSFCREPYKALRLIHPRHALKLFPIIYTTLLHPIPEASSSDRVIISRCGTTGRLCRQELPFHRFLHLRPRNPRTRCFHRRLHLPRLWRPRPMRRRGSRRRLENGNSSIRSGTVTRGNSDLSRRRKKTCLLNMSGKLSGKC